MCPAVKTGAVGRLSTRAWSDAQVWTHLALLPGIAVALWREPCMLELVVLQSIVCVLSVIWHRSRERECGLAKIEHAFAHALFAYGAVQTWYSPSAGVLALSLACACVTLTVYVVTNARADLWDFWHPIGLHVVPGLWSLVIACYHRSLFDVWDLREYFD